MYFKYLLKNVTHFPRPPQVLKEILREIDSTLTEDDLESIIEEVDEDGSGTLDFDEFQEMMMG